MASHDAQSTDSSVKAVIGRLVRQGLHSREAVKDIYHRWKSDPKANHTDATHFLRWMVRQQYLTPEQAATFVANPKAMPEAEKPDWDVELVKALPMQEIAISIGRLRLSRRDLLMLGVGAATVAAAGVVSMVIARR